MKPSIDTAVPSAEPVFHALAELTTEQLGDLLQLIRVRVLRFLEKRGVIEGREQLVLLDHDFVEREPALAQLAAASVNGLVPAGPECRERRLLDRLTLRGEAGVVRVAELGFSFHARTRPGRTIRAASSRTALMRLVNSSRSTRDASRFRGNSRPIR